MDTRNRYACDTLWKQLLSLFTISFIDCVVVVCPGFDRAKKRWHQELYQKKNNNDTHTYERTYEHTTRNTRPFTAGERNSLTYATLAVYGFLVWFVCYWFVRHENFLVGVLSVLSVVRVNFYKFSWCVCVCVRQCHCYSRLPGGVVVAGAATASTAIITTHSHPFYMYSLFFHPPIMQRSAAKWESAEEHTFIHIHSVLLLCTRNCYTFLHYEAVMKSSRFSIKMTRTTTQHAYMHISQRTLERQKAIEIEAIEMHVSEISKSSIS